MLPSRTRGRYPLFILFSLLVHFTVIVALFWNANEKEEQVKTDKAVTVTLKKEEPKKEEPKKEEAKKEEAKKEEAKKEEAKKAEAKKAEAKKAEAKKAEAKKAEAKKAEAKKAESKFSPYQSSVDVYSQEQAKDLSKTPTEFIKYGSMAVLDDREMKRAVIYTRGYGNRFKTRQYEGQIIKKSLSDYEKQILNKHLVSEAEYIFTYHKAPKKDGRKYYGEISLLLNSEGEISEITLKLPSGSNELDESVYNALIQAKRLKLPNDPLLRKAMITSPLTLNYSDEEMVD